MMDPFTISMALAPLLLSSAKLAKLVGAVKDSYKNAPTTLISTSAQCKLMHVALSKVQGLLSTTESDFSVRLTSQKKMREAFDDVLTGCRMTLAALNLEVSKLIEPKPKGGTMEMSFQAKVKLVWNEDVMKQLLDQTKGQMTTLHFLITVLESETQTEILRLLQQYAAPIHRALCKARSIRSIQGFDDTESCFHLTHQSIAYGVTQSYEEQLTQSSAYRKAQTAAAEELLAAKLELMEEKYELEEKLDSIYLTMASKDEKVAELEHEISSIHKDMALKDGRVTELEFQISSKHKAETVNKSTSEELKRTIRGLEKPADKMIRQTYVEGIRTKDVLESAVVLNVGLIFLPGAKPQVTLIEQIDMTNQESDQKNAEWRVKTAESLLVNFDVCVDLSILQTDQTANIAKEARSRLKKSKSLSQENQKPLSLGGQVYEAVAIDSQFVKIVHDLRQDGPWDLQATLIEVDCGSLLSLIITCRCAMQNSGPETTFEETCMCLETMIIDVRRLWRRSPILSRMSTRAKIINSKNTRYGANHREAFQTLTTSKGFREIISVVSSYYNSMDFKGNARRSLRARFLQMIVLLLSLLNDDDLGEITEFLESTYQLKANRHDLELLFLKVIPLSSINSWVFLRDMVAAFEGFPLNSEHFSNNLARSHAWEIFIQRILEKGYLLPGTTTDLGRVSLSWIIKWPGESFQSISIFSNLQYLGQLRRINDIPPIQITAESSIEELTVIMTNGDKYNIDSSDLDRILCLTPGTYTMKEARPEGRRHDLQIEELLINAPLQEAIKSINIIIGRVNFDLDRRRARMASRLLGMRTSEPTFLNDLKGSGRLTQKIAKLNNDILAIIYKVEERKITGTELIQSIDRDIQQLRYLIKEIESRYTILDNKPSSDGTQYILQGLEGVEKHTGLAERIRHRLADADEICDNPIAKIFYPDVDRNTEPNFWSPCVAWRGDARELHIQAKAAKVNKVVWVSDMDIEISFHDSECLSKYHVTPLKPIEEGCRNDQVEISDIGIFAGNYLMIAHGSNPETGLIMKNYLKVTAVEEKKGTNQRMNEKHLVIR